MAGPLLPSDHKLSLRDCWINNERNFSLVSFIFPSIIQRTIHSSASPLNVHSPDSLFWKPSPLGKLSDSSAYLTSKPFPYLNPLRIRGGCGVLPQIRESSTLFGFPFIGGWTLLITCSTNIITSNVCPCCHLFEEFALHCLRDCPVAAKHWDSLSVPSLLLPTFHSDIDQCGLKLTSWPISSIALEFHGVSFFLLLFVHIWLQRNNML